MSASVGHPCIIGKWNELQSFVISQNTKIQAIEIDRNSIINTYPEVVISKI